MLNLYISIVKLNHLMKKWTCDCYEKYYFKIMWAKTFDISWQLYSEFLCNATPVSGLYHTLTELPRMCSPPPQHAAVWFIFLPVYDLQLWKLPPCNLFCYADIENFISRFNKIKKKLMYSWKKKYFLMN